MDAFLLGHGISWWSIAIASVFCMVVGVTGAWFRLRALAIAAAGLATFTSATVFSIVDNPFLFVFATFGTLAAVLTARTFIVTLDQGEVSAREFVRIRSWYLKYGAAHLVMYVSLLVWGTTHQ